MSVTVQDMMEAREMRAARQQALLARYGQTLLSFTLNIPGPIKDSPLIRRGFSLGQAALQTAFCGWGIRPLHEETHLAETGCEALYVLPMDPLAAKEMVCTLEERDELGRLFDMDVLRPGGEKVERGEIGLPGRRCLLCGNVAQLCARSRTHTVPELQARIREILLSADKATLAARVSKCCCRALLFEVGVTPKPGLVDRANSGSHRDMDVFTFFESAAALGPYFARCAAIGYDTAERDPQETFSAIRSEGRLAEGTMFRATGGVNTHKGAIFSLGLLAAAAGRLKQDRPGTDALLSETARMTAGITARDFQDLTEENARTAGQRLYLRYGITGVRGEAEAGFPLVAQVGMPKLRAALSHGLSLNDAGCAALIAMLAVGTDTNVISRGGIEAASALRERAQALLADEPFPTRASLEVLDRSLIERNLSPGGTADLLALCFFLHFLEEDD